MKSPNLKVLEIQRTNLNIRIEVHKKQEVRMKIKGSFWNQEPNNIGTFLFLPSNFTKNVTCALKCGTIIKHLSY